MDRLQKVASGAMALGIILMVSDYFLNLGISWDLATPAMWTAFAGAISWMALSIITVIRGAKSNMPAIVAYLFIVTLFLGGMAYSVIDGPTQTGTFLSYESIPGDGLWVQLRFKDANGRVRRAFSKYAAKPSLEEGDLIPYCETWAHTTGHVAKLHKLK